MAILIAAEWKGSFEQIEKLKYRKQDPMYEGRIGDIHKIL